MTTIELLELKLSIQHEKSLALALWLLKKRSIMDPDTLDFLQRFPHNLDRVCQLLIYFSDNKRYLHISFNKQAIQFLCKNLTNLSISENLIKVFLKLNASAYCDPLGIQQRKLTEATITGICQYPTHAGLIGEVILFLVENNIYTEEQGAALCQPYCIGYLDKIAEALLFWETQQFKFSHDDFEMLLLNPSAALCIAKILLYFYLNNIYCSKSCRKALRENIFYVQLIENEINNFSLQNPAVVLTAEYFIALVNFIVAKDIIHTGLNTSQPLPNIFQRVFVKNDSGIGDTKLVSLMLSWLKPMPYARGRGNTAICGVAVTGGADGAEADDPCNTDLSEKIVHITNRDILPF